MLMACLEIITIGLPFCAFKIITGLLFKQHWLVGLGLIDLFVNLFNLLNLLLRKRRVFDACLFSFLVRLIKRPDEDKKSRWEDLGNAIDVSLSFALVAIVIGGDQIKNLPLQHLSIWNISVILNVFGAGTSRLTSSIQNLK